MSDKDYLENIIHCNVDYKTGAYHKVIIDKVNELRSLLEAARLNLYYEEKPITYEDNYGNGIDVYGCEFKFKKSSNPGFIFYKDKENEL